MLSGRDVVESYGPQLLALRGIVTLQVVRPWYDAPTEEPAVRTRCGVEMTGPCPANLLYPHKCKFSKGHDVLHKCVYCAGRW